MKTSFILGFSLLLLNIQINTLSQIMWSRTYGGNQNDFSSSVVQTLDDSYLIAGYTASYGNGGSDIWLIKSDLFGDTLWTKTYGGSGRDLAYDIKQTYDNGFILVGRSYSYSQSGDDLILIKTDSLGNLIWSRIYGNNISLDAGFSIEQTSDQGFIVVGFTSSPIPGTSQVWLLKTDASGDTVWTKTYGTDATGLSITKVFNNGFAIAGLLGPDIWLLRTDEVGDTIWTKRFSASWGGEICLQQTLDAGFIIGGSSVSHNSMLIKTDSLGNTQWIKNYSGGNVNSVQQTLDEGYVIATGNAWDAILIKTNSAGEVHWLKTYGGDSFDDARFVQQTSDEGYIIVGKTASFGSGGWDAIVIKTDEFGNTSGIVSVKNTNITFSTYVLSQNYPNPFNPATSIQYAISSRQFVSLKVYDLLGREVATLVNEEKPVGNYEVEFDSRGLINQTLPSGIYFYQLHAGNFLKTKKMLLLK